MKYRYTFTIITCTINKFEKLIRLIKSLKNQNYRNFELIIIDQSNEDKIKQLQKYKIPIKYIKKKEKGLSRSRNLGIKLSKGKYLLFTDDDCYFNVNFLYQIKNAYKKYKTDLIGFPIFNKNKNNTVVKINNSNFFINNDLNVIKYLCSVNFCIKNKNLLKFDENLGLGIKKLSRSGEDTDFLLRNHKNKEYFYYSKIKVWHLNHNKNILIKRFYYGIGSTCCLLKNRIYFLNLMLMLKVIFNIAKNLFKLNFIETLKLIFFLVGKIFGFFYYYLHLIHYY